MKPTDQHFEILLYSGTNPFNKQLIDKKENHIQKDLTPKEEVEKACWNGIVFEMFPELFGSGYPKCELFIWEVLNCESFIYINMGPGPETAKSNYSINPYICNNSFTEN